MTQWTMVCESDTAPSVGSSAVPSGSQTVGGVLVVDGAPIAWTSPVACSSVSMVETGSLGAIFSMSPAQGSEVAAAMLLVLAVGWAFRSIIRTLKSTDEEDQNA